MKLWYSFLKEMQLASKSYYFYIELFMAVILLLILLFVVPEEFNSTQDEYLYLDLPEAVFQAYETILEEEDLDGAAEQVEVEIDDVMYGASLYTSETTNFYIMEDEEAVRLLAEEEREFGAVISLDDEGRIAYEYLLQGYESERLQNLYLILHNNAAGLDEMTAYMDAVPVESLDESFVPLNDRQNIVPVFLAFNGSLMGIFIVAAYVFLDKSEGIIKAYTVTTSSVWQYLMSKAGVIIVTALCSSMIVTIPVMGLQPNYPMMLLFLVTTGFAAASLGLVLTSYYSNMMQSFGLMYILIILMALPNAAYFIPSWEPVWIKAIPSYFMIQSFRELILENGDMMYVLKSAAAFLAAGIGLFLFADYRFKKTLTM